jgi:hypothetical protein
MTKFLVLSKYLINTTHVSHVKILPTQYKIYLNTISFGGNFIWHSSDADFFEICKDKQPQDYQVVDNWIKSFTNQIK